MEIVGEIVGEMRMALMFYGEEGECPKNLM